MVDYKKLYEETFEKLQNIIYNHKKQGHIIVPIEDIENGFPELKENEDERIRKEIIRVFKGEISFTSEKENEKYIAWLEKQGKQKPSNTVKPKFKIGDFLVNDYCVGKVIELTNDAYLLDTEQGIPFSYEHNVHLWTIQDAKGGDVLAFDNDTVVIFKNFYNSSTFHSYCHIDDGVFEDKEGWWDSEDLYPATKEQRDLLFAKMKEAGYEWDADKKELKKIEQNPAEWTKEDEVMLDAIISNYEFMGEEWIRKHEKELGTPADGARKDNAEEINWLKSLKDRVQSQDIWKPSDEQMKALGSAIHCYAGISPTNNKEVYALEIMKKQLKKLKEE